MLGAILTAGASILGGALGGKSQSKAADKAAEAQLQGTRENNALAREFRAENTANFAPYMQSGTRANALLDSFLYGPQAAAPAPAPVPAPGAPSLGGGAPALPQPSQMQGEPMHLGPGMLPDTAIGRRLFQRFGGLNAPTLPAQQPQGAVTATPPANPMSGYQQFVASPYYQFPLQEGHRSLNHGLASRGAINSGAAIKEAIKYGQNYGYGRMGEYIGLAERQAGRGISGASAIAGVGQNALMAMSQNNQTAADALSNAAIARGAANTNMWNGIFGGLGQLAGGLGSSYGKGF